MKKKCLITGGGRGLGLAMKQKLVAAGFEVITPSRADMDLSDVEAVKSFLQKFDQCIDVLINNAGENIVNPIEKIKFEDWQRMMNTNLSAVFLLTQHFASQMAKNGGGKILNVSSIYSFMNRVGRAAYSSSKAGLNALTRSTAIEFGPNGVLVNSISPGFVDTDLTHKNNTEAQIQQLVANIPVGRMAQSREIAEVAWFLVSDKNTYISGQNIVIDGAFSCQ